MYLSILARSICPYTQEAAIGALQNITAGNGLVRLYHRYMGYVLYWECGIDLPMGLIGIITIQQSMLS
jgi:hypothetical protein